MVGIISQHINTPPVAPSWHNPKVPQALEALILRLLAKAPEDRPGSTNEVAKALEIVASSAPEVAEPVVQQDAKSLARLAGGVFVGRQQEVSALRTALQDALSGRGRLVMLAGEPGNGKTRIADDLATYARLRGAEVLIGRCYEGEGAPAFWPWVQVIRAYVHERRTEALMSTMGPGAADIAQVDSEIRERLPDLPAPPSLEPEQARFRLFDSLTNFLKNASKAQPLVLILDDLHWADKASLLLLEFLAREMRDARLLVIGTYRDTELGRQRALSQTLGELARQGFVERIVLRGLTNEDVRRFIELTVGFAPPEALVAAVYEVTEGNSFFVKEVVRLLVTEGRLEQAREVAPSSIRAPESVREVILRRLDHLSDESRRTLTVASVLGREFSLQAMESLSELPTDRLLEALEEAVTARVISEEAEVVGRYRFSHALVRETLYEELSLNRRVRLHRRIGEVLEKLYGRMLDPHLAELAYHFFQAAPGGDAEKAIHYAVRAAERATGLLAYEDAVGHYERALQALELKEQAKEGNRCELFLALGEAQTKAGDTEKARENFQVAAELARKEDDPEQLARAVLGIGAGPTGITFGRVDDFHVGLLKEALGALGKGDSALRARLLAQLSLALYYSPQGRRAQVSQEAVEMARRVGNSAAWLAALYSRCLSLTGFEEAEERLAIATEIVRVADEAGDKEMALRGHFRRLRELLELGEIHRVDEEIEIYDRLAQELRQPRYLWLAPFARASRAMLAGRFEDCEQLSQKALAIGERAQDQNAALFFATHMVTLRRLQGRPEELVEKIKGFVQKYPSITGWRATLAVIYCEMGRREEAQSEFEHLASQGFAELPRDGAWVAALAGLSQVCAFLGDSRRAAALYELLLPFAGRNIVVGSAATFFGTISRQLGFLAATMSRWDEAAKHFEDALEMNAKMGARPFEVYSQHAYGDMLLARNDPGDRKRAYVLFEQAFVTARKLGMKKVIETLGPLLAQG
jgi:tetratricopeptide (TPR) repeat protein